jgi:hypothetical protein
VGELARESYPGDPPRKLRWSGRTGVGQDIELYEVGPWIELVYYEFDGQRRGGFALNPLYAGQLVVELVRLTGERAVEGCP